MHNVEDSLNIFFRVRRVMKDKYLYAESGGKVLAKVKKLHLAPGEMESIRIPKEKLMDVVDSIIVRVGD